MKFATPTDVNTLKNVASTDKNTTEIDLTKEINKLKMIGDYSEQVPSTSIVEVTCNKTDDRMRIPVCVVKTQSNDKKKDVYMIAEGYHKTDSCYYKTTNGGYHKLPQDSYHKMSEICYKKLPDGTFRRLVDMQNDDNNCPGIASMTSTGTQNKVRNNMIKFLKRSKSHSQATAKENYVSYRKEIQQNKEKGIENRHDILKSDNSGITAQNPILSGQNNIENKHVTHNKRHSTHSSDRKVVITMMENGGLPIVATSKGKSPKIEYKSHHQRSVREKVK